MFSILVPSCILWWVVVIIFVHPQKVRVLADDVSQSQQARPYLPKYSIYNAGYIKEYGRGIYRASPKRAHNILHYTTP